jgi:hypothetical protein
VPITGTVMIDDGAGSRFVRQAVFLMRTPNLAASYQTVSSWLPSPGDTVTFTVRIQCGRGEARCATRSRPLIYEPGSLLYAGSEAMRAASSPDTACRQAARYGSGRSDSNAVRGQVMTNTADYRLHWDRPLHAHEVGGGLHTTATS